MIVIELIPIPLQPGRRYPPESIYTRFFHPVTELTDQYLKRATELDFDREAALVVTHPNPIPTQS